MRSRKNSRKDSIKSAGQEAINYLIQSGAIQKPYGDKVLYKRQSEILLEIKKENSHKKKGSLKLARQMQQIFDHQRSAKTMQRFETDDAITIFSSNSDYLRKPTVNSRLGDSPRSNSNLSFVRKFYILYFTKIWTEVKNQIKRLIEVMKLDEIELEEEEVNNIMAAAKKVNFD